jgi:hypothetical protein
VRIGVRRGVGGGRVNPVPTGEDVNLRVGVPALLGEVGGGLRVCVGGEEERTEDGDCEAEAAWHGCWRRDKAAHHAIRLQRS